MLVGQGLLAIYGGYFGGAVGIMMMALWGIWGYTELRAVNGAKSLFVGATNAVAVLCFIVAGQVRWGPGLALAAGAGGCVCTRGRGKGWSMAGGSPWPAAGRPG